MLPQGDTRVHGYVQRLQFPLSRDRLSSYLIPGISPLEAIATYFWNSALSEALHPALDAAEIALRNSIHAGLTQRYASEDWFDVPDVLLEDQHNDVEANRRWLLDHGKPSNPGRVVARLSFGFWVTLLNSPYEERIWEPHGFALLRAVFPYATRKQRRRGPIQQRFFSINRLRNRVMHYEPIWNNPHLASRHENILEAIGWISPDLEQTVRRIDRFPDVYENGRDRIQSEIETLLGIA